MTQPAQQRPCGYCLRPGSPVISQSFSEKGIAFRRHAELVETGSAPSMCMRRDGTCYVCHLGQKSR